MASSPEEVEADLDAALQRNLVNRKVVSSNIRNAQTLSIPETGITPGAGQTMAFAQVPVQQQTGVRTVVSEMRPVQMTLAPPQVQMMETRASGIGNRTLTTNTVTAGQQVPLSVIGGGLAAQMLTPSSQVIKTSRIQTQLPAAQTYNSYYVGGVSTVAQVPQQQQQQTVTKTTTEVVRPHSVEPVAMSKVVTRVSSADTRISMDSGKRFNKKKLNPSVYRQPTIYALESSDPNYLANIESLGIQPAFHPIRGVYKGHKFPPYSILLAPYERRQEVINGIADGLSKDLSCVFYGEQLQADPIMMNHPSVDLATNKFEQVRDYLRVRGIRMAPVPVSVTSIALPGNQVSSVKQEQIIVGTQYQPPLSVIHETNSYH